MWNLLQKLSQLPEAAEKLTTALNNHYDAITHAAAVAVQLQAITAAQQVPFNKEKVNMAATDVTVATAHPAVLAAQQALAKAEAEAGQQVATTQIPASQAQPAPVVQQPAQAAAVAAKQPGKVKKLEQGFVSFWHHVTKYYTASIDELIVYTPDMVQVAELILPEYKLLEDSAGRVALLALTGLRNVVIQTQQKYSDAAASGETNKQKLADALAVGGPQTLQLLQSVGIKADTPRLENLVAILIDLLKVQVVPADAVPATAVATT